MFIPNSTSSSGGSGIGSPILRILVRFDFNRFFTSDSEDVISSLQSIIQAKPKKNGGYKIGTVPEFVGLAMIADEYTSMCPTIKVMVLDRDEGELDPVYNEPIRGVASVQRTLMIRSLLKYTPPAGKYEETGVSYSHDVTASFSLVSLIRSDWSPSEGDRFIHLGRLYGINTVYIDEKSLHGHTGLPTFITCSASSLRGGDGPIGYEIVRTHRPRNFSRSTESVK
jgi:hypothetical protein